MAKNAKQENQLSVEEILEKYDRESTFRKNLGLWAWVVTFLGVSLTVFHMYTAWFGILQSQIQGAVHLGTALGLIFLLYPIKAGMHRKQTGVPWYDIILAFVAIFVCYYNVFEFDALLKRTSFGYTAMDIVVASLGVLLVLEATRRCVGLPIVVVAIAAIAYALWGNKLPMFSHRGFSWSVLSSDLYFKTDGIFGIPIRVSSTFIFLFLFFGVMLTKTGIGKYFNDLAFAMTGRFTGGPAKAAVAASALQGMITGSSVANTVGSGSFTIPMMKKTGYKPEFAAATEASASTGGQIMPPVMGAAAFIMAEYTGVPYSQIMIYAAIPAVLYFTGVFLGVHFESKKQGILGLPASQLPRLKELLIKQGYLLLPLLMIIYTLLSGKTPIRAALIGIAVAFVVSFFSRETRFTVRGFIDALEQGARAALPVIAACACAGIIVGVVVLTGLGSKIAGGIIMLAGNVLILTLFFTMIACIILGMGLPTTANYVVTATVAAPALIALDVPAMAAHLFVFYFGIVADITPPVCLAAYAGAGIARANPFKTGVIATKLALAAFLIPYMFVYNPVLILVDYKPVTLFFGLLSALIGMIGISSSAMGYFIRRTQVWERIILFVGGAMLIEPHIISDVIGYCLVAIVLFIQSRRPQDAKKLVPSDTSVNL
ncbi:TRAP transporter permease [Brevibacillus sp. B_LB10_24]|uniref:TRAP transporter permease n=1 Tax=Brevibacillus sp. B_LB10_24 TaxID=3380645 RepID=UPI0038BC55F5